MKKILGFCIALLISGCSTYGTEDVKNLVNDPHFAAYQKNLDELESSYLKEEIKYSDYLNKKKQLEDDYNKEVKERNDIISSP